MLITETAIAKWHGNNRKWFEARGYIWTKKGNIFECKVEDVPNSNMYSTNVQVKCDLCKSNKIIETSLSKYKSNIDRNNGIYLCDACEKNKKYSKYEGMIIGRLTIIKYLGHYKYNTKMKKHWFECNCSCGNEHIIKELNYLFQKELVLKSCDCWNSERTIQFNKSTKTAFNNEYYIKDGDYYIKAIRKNINYEVIVEKEMFNYLVNKNRTLSVDCRGYAFVTKEDSKRQLFIHNLVIFGEDYYTDNMKINVDHINSKEIRDDRKSNLRPANDFQNTQNAKIRKDNTCGIKGFTIKFPTNRPSAGISVRIQSHKTRIGQSFEFSEEGLTKAITWNHNERILLHKEFANFGYDAEGKSLEDIIIEQSKIFISNLTEEQKKVFYNNGYLYKPIKNKPKSN